MRSGVTRPRSPSPPPSTRPTTSLALAAVGLCLLSAPGAAHAYVLKHTDRGDPVRWHAAEIVLCVARSPRGSALRRADVHRAAVIAANAWSAIPGVPTLRVLGQPCELGALDGVNSIAVVEDWGHGSRLAVTRSSYLPGGELLEADVLINGEMPLAMLDEGGPRESFDLGSVLTHEMGHVLGLDESEDRAAAMWPTTPRGRTDRRELAPDDVDGVLALYGGAGGALTVTYGCAAAPRPRSTGWALALLVLLALGLRSRAAGTSCRSASARPRAPRPPPASCRRGPRSRPRGWPSRPPS